jgi:hypothetical protein
MMSSKYTLVAAADHLLDSKSESAESMLMGLSGFLLEPDG